ncbi:MAG: rhodanese-like domain-containing protein [Pseudomonadota bacterium]
MLHRVAIAISAISITSAMFLVGSSRNHHLDEFATWSNTGLDTLASIWLIENYISPGVNVALHPIGSEFNAEVVFGTENSSIRRTGEQTMFSMLLEKYQVDAEEAFALDKTISIIEIAPWAKMPTNNSLALEQSLRSLIERKDPISQIDCVKALFDEFASTAVSGGQISSSDDFTKVVLSQPSCQSDEHRPPSATPSTFPIDEVLRQISEHKQVIFIDVRESDEFAERRIPGALNIPLRKINSKTAEQLIGADLVIPYCVKDFRAYEAARKLRSVDVFNVGTLNPFGLAGWIANDLPTAGKSRMTDRLGTSLLYECAISNCSSHSTDH